MVSCEDPRFGSTTDRSSITARHPHGEDRFELGMRGSAFLIMPCSQQMAHGAAASMLVRACFEVAWGCWAWAALTSSLGTWGTEGRSGSPSRPPEAAARAQEECGYGAGLRRGEVLLISQPCIQALLGHSRMHSGSEHDRL